MNNDNAVNVLFKLLGGAYAINAGLFGDNIKQVYYFVPDTLEWEQSHDSYSQFLQWLANGDIDEYYSNMRWRDWKKEVKVLKGDQGISVFPYLWTKQGKNVEENHRQAMPMKEIWGIQHEIKNQFGI